MFRSANSWSSHPLFFLNPSFFLQVIFCQSKPSCSVKNISANTLLYISSKIISRQIIYMHVAPTSRINSKKPWNSVSGATFFERKRIKTKRQQRLRRRFLASWSTTSCKSRMKLHITNLNRTVPRHQIETII